MTSVDQQRRPVVLAAPITGWVAPLSEVPDPVFSERILGDGVAIDPTGSTLCAPCDGTVINLHRGRHALTLLAANGAEILLHIGIDTVELGGDGLIPHVAEGQTVKAGDRLISFDLDRLSRRVKSVIIPIVLTNGEGYVLRNAETGREIAAGQPLMEIAPLGGPADDAPIAGDEVRREVVCRDPHGIHARPAGLLARCAKEHASTVTLLANGRSANARSPVALMRLGVQKGDPITILAQGPDAAEVAGRLAELLELSEPAEPLPLAAAAPAPAARPSLPPLAAGEQARLAGVRAAPGQAIGRAFRLAQDHFDIAEAGAGVAAETAAFHQALAQAKADLQAAVAAAGNRQQTAILAAHLDFLDDPELFQAAAERIAMGDSAAFAWQTAVDQQIAALRALGDPLLAERADDLLDVERRVLMILLGKKTQAPTLFDDAILIAEDLLPSVLSGLDTRRIAGLCLAKGGPTSHIAIMAASMGIPAMVAAGPDVLRVPHGAPLFLDADNGLVQVNPPPAEVERIGRQLGERRRRAEDHLRQAGADCRMADGTRIQVMANLGAVDDAPLALARGAEGCGLLRSEFLFLDRATPPSEEEQRARYQAIATALDGRPLIIRTLDAGGDKDLPYAELPAGENPALGLRGVRMGMLRPDLLRSQLRAILRVEPAGQCSIMLPMVATLDELRDARSMLEEEKAKLGHSAEVALGIMIEVPSAALMADRFAAEADFFSVGTNDLTQYTLAMDRGNPHLAPRLDAFHPAVLRLIATAAQGARAQHRWIGVCGGLASSPLAAPVLIGLGVTELSATPAAVPEVKALVRRLTQADCQWAAEQALAQDSAEAVRRLLAERWPEA